MLHVGNACRYLAIFGVKVQHLLISGSSMAVAFAFVFGNSLREVYESILWLFVVNPYDEGALMLLVGHRYSRNVDMKMRRTYLLFL